MSVILTAARRNYLKKRDEKLKLKKKARRLAKASTPPMSSDGTTVWFWELDGIPTTVMYNEDRNEVWCNGYILEIMEGYENDLDIAGYIEFDIFLDQTSTVYEGHIRRILDPPGLSYQLYVNGCPIMEHAPDGSRSCPPGTYNCPPGSYSTPPLDDSPEIMRGIYGQGLLPGYLEAFDAPNLGPPCYEDAICDDRKSKGRMEARNEDVLLKSFRRQCGVDHKKMN
jgi:hypothetical protein